MANVRAQPPTTSLRALLEGEERRLLTVLKPLRAKLTPLERELLDVQRALRAIGAVTESMTAPRTPRSGDYVAKRAENAVSTLTDILRQILAENRAGLSSVEIHRLATTRLGRDVRDENVRGQLSRLKKNGQAAWFDGLWYAFDDAPNIGMSHT